MLDASSSIAQETGSFIYERRTRGERPPKQENISQPDEPIFKNSSEDFNQYLPAGAKEFGIEFKPGEQAQIINEKANVDLSALYTGDPQKPEQNPRIVITTSTGVLTIDRSRHVTFMEFDDQGKLIKSSTDASNSKGNLILFEGAVVSPGRTNNTIFVLETPPDSLNMRNAMTIVSKKITINEKPKILIFPPKSKSESTKT